MVPAGSRVADIGTDRALLPRRLLAEGRASHCIATERDARRADRARRGAIDLLAGARIEVRAGDGLSVLGPSDRIDVVVIAGLGGPAIRTILDRGNPADLGVRRFVLQPQTDVGAVRAWLAAHGFPITDERLVTEGNRWFTVIAADAGPPEECDSARSPLSPEDLLEVGPRLATSGAPQVVAYWRGELARVESILALAGDGSGRGRREALSRRDLARRVVAALQNPEPA